MEVWRWRLKSDELEDLGFLLLKAGAGVNLSEYKLVVFVGKEVGLFGAACRMDGVETGSGLQWRNGPNGEKSRSVLRFWVKLQSGFQRTGSGFRWQRCYRLLQFRKEAMRWVPGGER